MAKFYPDPHFKALYSSLQTLIAGYGNHGEDITSRQKKQVESLIAAENKFKKALLNDSRGPLVYKKFIKYIVEKNILAARPYFRERQALVSKYIFPAIRNQNHKALYKFSINYPFIEFALNCFPWGPNSKITKASKEVVKIRKEIIELNMPLAISQAKVFRHNTPDSHLTYMDLIQISFEGLINAVDKFVPPYTTVFRSVIIGRVKGDLIESYSDTMLHHWPGDKRKLYRVNKILKGKDREEIDFERLADSVNTSGPKLPVPTSAGEIQNLLSASSHYSMNSPVPDNGTEDLELTLNDTYADSPETRPDIMVEQHQAHQALYGAIEGLSSVEIKLLRLKGIDV